MPHEAAPAQAQVQARSPRISVATYNIHQCIGTDGRCDPERVAKVLQELGADILALQEVDATAAGIHESGQVDYLAAATGMQAVAGLMIRRHIADFGNVLLSAHPIKEVRHIDLSIPGREPRGAIDADLEIDGAPVRVIVTHLGLGARERRKQVKKLLQAIAHPDGTENMRLTILLGDINEWAPLTRPLRWINARMGRPPAARTFPASFPVFALDRIWVRPAQALSDMRVHITPVTRVASDHLPIAANIDLGLPG
jgi:endonuclease/exonuclease/phosphatase family metal-dependent hydrolase